MMRYVIPLLLMLLATPSVAKELSFPEQESIPSRVRTLFSEQKLDTQYAFSSHLNPFLLSGDFNGDGALDIAVLIEEKRSHKIGIAIVHPKPKTIAIIGAGKVFVNDDHLQWMDAWQVVPKEATPSFKGDALLLIKTESASGLAYWDGKGYSWYQQGD